MIRWYQTDIGNIGFHGIPIHVADGIGVPDRGRAGHPALRRLPAPGQPRRRVPVGVRPGRHDRRRHLTPDALRAAAARRRPDDDRCRGPSGRGARLRRRARRRPRGQRLEPAADAWPPRPRRPQRIRLGTFVLNASLHHPLMLAREVATLDHLSGGRVELGLGAGHTPAEFAAAGVPFLPGRRAQGPAGRVRRDRPAPARRRDGRPPRRPLRPDGRSTGRRLQERLPILVGGSGRACSPTPPAHADIVGFTGLGRTLPDGHRHAARFQPEVARRGGRRRSARPPADAAGRAQRARPAWSRSPTTGRRRRRRLAEPIEDLTVDDALATPFLALGTHDEIADQLRRPRSAGGSPTSSSATPRTSRPCWSLRCADVHTAGTSSTRRATTIEAWTTLPPTS